MVTGPSGICGADALRRTRMPYQCEFPAVRQEGGWALSAAGRGICF